MAAHRVSDREREEAAQLFQQLSSHLSEEQKHALLLQALDVCGPKCLEGFEVMRDSILANAVIQEPGLLKVIQGFLEDGYSYDAEGSANDEDDQHALGTAVAGGEVDGELAGQGLNDDDGDLGEEDEYDDDGEAAIGGNYDETDAGDSGGAFGHGEASHLPDGEGDADEAGSYDDNVSGDWNDHLPGDISSADQDVKRARHV